MKHKIGALPESTAKCYKCNNHITCHKCDNELIKYRSEIDLLKKQVEILTNRLNAIKKYID